MADINVKIMHPTNNSYIDIDIPENIVLRDVFSHLIDTDFLTVEQYSGKLMPRGTRDESTLLDNDKTLGENGIKNSDFIAPFIMTQAFQSVPSAKIYVKFVHPTNNSDIDIELSENTMLRDVYSQLIEANFLSSGQPYTGVLKPNGELVDTDKTIGENGVENNNTIQIMIATQAGYGPPLASSVRFVHPTILFDIDIDFSDNVFFKDKNMDNVSVEDIFRELIHMGFLSPEASYAGVILANPSRNSRSVLLNNEKSIRMNCVEDNDTIQIVMLN